MDAHQKQLVQDSFALVAPQPLEAARLFYARLFELDPSLRPLFKGDMDEQGAKLMGMLATAVGALDRLETIVPAVQALGARHAGYGVKEADYATVGGALLDTLAAALGPAFTPQTRGAWVDVYTTLAAQMQEGARNADQTGSRRLEA